MSSSNLETPGATIESPSIADSTEILGVKIPSAANNEIASMLIAITTTRCRCCTYRNASTPNASVPPSPSLSARMITRMYLTVTTNTSVQMNNERRPSTSSRFVLRPKTSLKAA